MNAEGGTGGWVVGGKVGEWGTGLVVSGRAQKDNEGGEPGGTVKELGESVCVCMRE